MTRRASRARRCTCWRRSWSRTAVPTPEPPGDHQRVDRAGDRSDRGGGELEPATGANRSAADGNDFGLVLSALDVPGRAREDLQGPGHVEDLGRVEARDDHADWAHGLSIRSALASSLWPTS